MAKWMIPSQTVSTAGVASTELRAPRATSAINSQIFENFVISDDLDDFYDSL